MEIISNSRQVVVECPDDHARFCNILNTTAGVDLPRATSQKAGYIYLMRLHPENRYKVGFTKDRKALEGRLKEAQTWVPEATVVKTWSAQERWESLARFVITSSAEVGRAVAQFHYGDWSRRAGKWWTMQTKPR